MGKPLRVLIVEDVEDDALLMVLQLRRAGYATTFERVETPQAYEAALDGQVWDFVLSDWSLPHFSGLEALRRLRGRGSDLPFIIVSGTIDEAAAVAAMKAGANDYMSKGDVGRLTPAVERELRDAADRRLRRSAESEREQALFRERATRTELAAAQEVDRLKTEFVNAVSHELRTPLTSILGYAEFLEDGLGGDLTPQQAEYVQQIEVGAQRLTRLVDDLLDFARLEAGTFKLRVAPDDLGEKVREVVDSLRPQAQEAQLSLSVDLPPEALVVPMDAHRIGQVLLNLVNNAIKFTPPGGEVQVRVVREDGGLRGEVSDTGVGIAAADLPRLFLKFSQLDPGLHKGGTGLGLSIAKAIIEAHGGEIGVESEPGRGSTFWFTLPPRAGDGRDSGEAAADHAA